MQALDCTALRYLRLMLLYYYPGRSRLHASCTALPQHLAPHHYLADQDYMQALHCTTLHCTTLHCTALHYLRLILLHLYPGSPRQHASIALHCDALHNLCLMLPQHYPRWPRLHASIALHCTALHCIVLHCTTSASYYLTTTLAGLDYVQALHCTAPHYLRLMLLHHYPGWL
jgi:hypothetical protein